LTLKSANWTFPADVGKVRLDQFMVTQLPGESRSRIQSWIREGSLRVNGEQVKTGHIPRYGDAITLQIPEDLPAGPQPEDLPVDILYEDNDIAVVVKPAGMVCHIGAGVRSGTLVNALLYHLGPIEAGDPARPGIVHRLDKGTSGLLVVAKNHRAHRELSKQFKDRKVHKEYLALVHGVPAQNSGTIDRDLGRDPVDRKKISVRARRKRRAVTHYQTECSFVGGTLLRIQIETGRTHQIRVHLSQMGHPVVGDPVYGGNHSLSGRSSCLAPRMFLHACRLTFSHPLRQEEMSFSSPLPSELEQFLAKL
jgi:23S rRNA pseudouridine1911/1915/1917 synthase